VSVVQGTQMGEGDLAGVRFGHSWVEADVVGQTGRVAIDYSSGNTLVIDLDTYRFERQAQDVHAYSVSATMELASSGDYGPWTTDVLSAWHP
jgi:hypothetical protein